MDMAAGATGSQPIFRRVIAAPFRTAPLVVWPSFAMLPVVVPLFVAPFFSLLLGVAFVARAATPGPGGKPSADWEQLIRAHLVWYPLMEPTGLVEKLIQVGGLHQRVPNGSRPNWPPWGRVRPSRWSIAFAQTGGW